MLRRLILIVIIFAVFMVFIMLNLENKCDINFGFSKFEEVPVFFTVFISFILGIVCSVTLIMINRKRNKMPEKDNKQTVTSADPVNPSADPVNPISARERFLSRKRANNATNGGTNVS